MADWTKAVQEYTKTRNAYKLLVEIAKEPKKYLYSGKDLIYADLDLYNNLLPIMDMRFDRSDKHLLVELSKKIAHHVRYGKNDNNGVWVYYGPNRVGLSTYSSDSEAESIIKMSKIVELWNDDPMKASLKDLFVPISMFAVDLYKKER